MRQLHIWTALYASSTHSLQKTGIVVYDKMGTLQSERLYQTSVEMTQSKKQSVNV